MKKRIWRIWFCLVFAIVLGAGTAVLADKNVSGKIKILEIKTGKFLGPGSRPYIAGEDLRNLVLDRIAVYAEHNLIFAWTPKNYQEKGGYIKLYPYDQNGRPPQNCRTVTMAGYRVTPQNMASFDHPAKKYWPYYFSRGYAVFVLKWLKIDNFTMNFG